jgi:hypothetical protein
LLSGFQTGRAAKPLDLISHLDAMLGKPTDVGFEGIADFLTRTVPGKGNLPWPRGIHLENVDDPTVVIEIGDIERDLTILHPEALKQRCRKDK